MKKLLLLLLLFIITSSLCYAIDDIKLYDNNNLFYEIYENGIYNEEYDQIYYIVEDKIFSYKNKSECGNIVINQNTIELNIQTWDTYKTCYLFNKKNGFLITKKNIDTYSIPSETISTYDEYNGLIQRKDFYINNYLSFYVTYIYEKNKLKKEITIHGIDNSCDSYTIYDYDNKTGNLTKEAYYFGDDTISYTNEYDPNTNKLIKYSSYTNGELSTEDFFNNETGKGIERRYYSSPIEYKKRDYLQFGQSGYYYLSDNYYLRTNFCSFYSMEDYAEKSINEPIDWNKYYTAIVKKYNFNKKTPGYDQLMDLINKEYLFDQYDFVLGNYNTNTYYCFDVDYKKEVDLSSCYEIQLIEKPIDYKAMNQSGNNKGPFGFDIAMTLDEVKSACNGKEPKFLGNDKYSITPIKQHNLFKTYEVYISNSVGLYAITGLSEVIKTSNYGTEVQAEFEKILYALEKKYGDFKIRDNVRSDYSKKDERYFIQSIREGGREVYAEWHKYTNNEEYDGLEEIILSIVPDELSNEKAKIMIRYQFKNYDAAQDELNDVL